MKNLLLGLVFLIIGQSITAQFDTKKIIDIYWESVKIESNGEFYSIKNHEKSYLIFHKNGTFSYVFSLKDLKETTKDRWKYDKRTQSFILSTAGEEKLDPIIFRVISVDDTELVLELNLNEKISKIYHKKMDDFK